MSNTYGLDASLRDTFQRKQKSVNIMVFINTIKNYNNKIMLTWNQSIHRITVSVINTRTVHRCRRIQKADIQNSLYVNQLLLFMSIILRKSDFSSRILFLSLCLSTQKFLIIYSWTMTTCTKHIRDLIVNATCIFVISKNKFLLWYNDWVYQSSTEGYWMNLVELYTVHL